MDCHMEPLISRTTDRATGTKRRIWSSATYCQLSSSTPKAIQNGALEASEGDTSPASNPFPETGKGWPSSDIGLLGI